MVCNPERGRLMGWSLERWLLVATFTCSCVVVVFGMGVQWNETTYVKATQKALADTLRTDYVRSDVYAADRRELTSAIDRLTKALEQRPEPSAPRGRMFDR